MLNLVRFQREKSVYCTALKIYLVARITSLAFDHVYDGRLASWSVEKTGSPEIRFELRQSLQR